MGHRNTYKCKICENEKDEIAKGVRKLFPCTKCEAVTTHDRE